MQQLKTFLALIILALAVSATSCHTFKRAAKTFDKHEKEAAQYCGVKFPVKPFTKTIVKTVKGKPDTVTVEGETVYADCSDAVTAALDEAAKKHVPVKCPPSRIIRITDTLILHDTTVVENTAVSEGLHLELVDTQAKQEKAEKQASTRLKWAFAGWGLSLLLIAFLALLFTGKIR